MTFCRCLALSSVLVFSRRKQWSSKNYLMTLLLSKMPKEYDPSVVKIQSDMALLRMVVTNLYTNAVKYSRVGGEISVGYLRQGGDLVITVKDSGMGIPVAEQQRVFSKIFRASNAIKEVPDGTVFNSND